jgi:hypothetical protein
MMRSDAPENAAKSEAKIPKGYMQLSQKEAFDKMSGEEATTEGLKRFNHLRETLSIKPDDALWGAIYALEFYTRIVERQVKEHSSLTSEIKAEYRQINDGMKAAIDAALEKYRDSGGAINFIMDKEEKRISIERVCFWLGVMLFSSIMSFIAGVYIAAAPSPPSWILGRNGWQGILFGVPAGWLLFVILATPCLLYVVEQGPRINQITGKEKYILIVKWSVAVVTVIFGIYVLLKTIFGV